MPIGRSKFADAIACDWSDVSEKISPQYLAGLFDGEGCVLIAKAKRNDCKRGVAYQVHARIQMRDLHLLMSIRKRYGGYIRQHNPGNGVWSASFTWGVCGNGVVSLFTAIGSYLILKNKQAEIALEFQKLKIEAGPRRCSDEFFQKYTYMYESIRELNKKGVDRE